MGSDGNLTYGGPRNGLLYAGWDYGIHPQRPRICVTRICICCVRAEFELTFDSITKCARINKGTTPGQDILYYNALWIRVPSDYGDNVFSINSGEWGDDTHMISWVSA